jgi:hypothetical protein
VEVLVPSGVDPVVVCFLWFFCLCYYVVLVQASGFSGFGLWGMADVGGFLAEFRCSLLLDLQASAGGSPTGAFS